MTDVQRGRIKIVEGKKRVRAYVGGELVADTIRPVLVWEKPQYPTYYLTFRTSRLAFAPPGSGVAGGGVDGGGYVQEVEDLLV